MCRGSWKQSSEAEDGVSRVWRLKVSSPWDSWSLVALFSFDEGSDADGRPRITNFHLPLDRLGLEEGKRYWAYEFWSGQFLGEIPREARKTAYRHPGDAQALILRTEKDDLQIGFFGPGVRLLVFREVRPHPWVVGTTFHQSGGLELGDVRWNPEGVLVGELERPPGEDGSIVIAGSPSSRLHAEIEGRRAHVLPGSNGAVVLPVVSTGSPTRWEVHWKR